MMNVLYCVVVGLVAMRANHDQLVSTIKAVCFCVSFDDVIRESHEKNSLSFESFVPLFFCLAILFVVAVVAVLFC